LPYKITGLFSPSSGGNLGRKNKNKRRKANPTGNVDLVFSK